MYSSAGGLRTRNLISVPLIQFLLMKQTIIPSILNIIIIVNTAIPIIEIIIMNLRKFSCFVISSWFENVVLIPWLCICALILLPASKNLNSIIYCVFNKYNHSYSKCEVLFVLRIQTQSRKNLPVFSDLICSENLYGNIIC